MDWLNDLITQTITLIGQGHPIALVTLFVVVILTEMGVPFPYIFDSALLLAGYQHGFSLQLLYTFIVIFYGRQCGSTIVYWSSHLLGRNLLNWLCRRFPRMESRIVHIADRLSNKAPIAVALPRLIGLHFPTSIAAGIIYIPYWSFVKGVALSALIFDGAISILGVVTGAGFRILGFTPHLWSIIAVFIVVMLLIIFVRFRRSRKIL
jgi:membrane protein DedA with SNARE-associated domain